MKICTSLSVLGLVSCLLIARAAEVPGERDSFPGWLGTDYTQPPPKKSSVDLSRVIQLSEWKPRAYLYKNFLSEAECNHIITKARPHLERSSVANSLSGSSEISTVRTSSGMFIQKKADPVIAAIEQRIAEWTFLPIANQEAMQVLRYTEGQKYEPHHDYFSDPVNKQYGGHRYATVLMYLNNVTLGGETVFPTARDDTPKDDTWSDCAKGYLAVKPSKGDALLFFSMHPDGSPDETSLHYACPVVKGVKWSAPKWIHLADFAHLYAHPSSEDGQMASDGSACTDTNALCAAWALSGECERNPEYMLQACRKACRKC